MTYLEDLFGIVGKTAIITGASRGLGRASAMALHGAGANVVLVGRDAKMLDETKSLLTHSNKSFIMEADVTSETDRKKVFSAAIQNFGKIDILINNAGIIRRSPAIEYSSKDWNEEIETDLSAVFFWSQDAARVMQKTGGGKIINIASLLSFSGGINVVAYAAAKGGVAQLTKALANEWAKYHINVNAIAPGYFLTDATDALRKNRERSDHILSRIPAGRFGDPNELAGAFIYLASGASDYMHGHIMTVDGGFNSY
ncbi:MAG: glucose 1-dehydrogenase [Bacteroidota bacterium]|nr:glucose 1-dehydrogenase [Bacteroidota bacterium]MDP4229491.1 glucose 1-dehydrogenase [Bacteroidota bacterium]MDP4236156.1 glucose 1-dehydrogenase [Bacteroidota bacterium]